MLERVGLPKDAADRYPIEFSGGQRQRVAIARTLMMSPQLVICDEAVSALDLSVQAQVLNLLIDLQSSLGLSYLFISHDLAVIRHVSHRLLVLYRGQAMEYGSASAIYDRPLHPYTQTLLAAAPAPDPSRRRVRRSSASARSTQTLQSSGVTSSSCPFAARCAHSTDLCRERRPELTATGDDHFVACHHWQKLTIDGPHPSRPAFPVRHQVR
jgi:oligopeptide/dipeptide ABC transporter ATP-binding protein